MALEFSSFKFNAEVEFSPLEFFIAATELSSLKFEAAQFRSFKEFCSIKFNSQPELCSLKFKLSASSQDLLNLEFPPPMAHLKLIRSSGLMW